VTARLLTAAAGAIALAAALQLPAAAAPVAAAGTAPATRAAGEGFGPAIAIRLPSNAKPVPSSDSRLSSVACSGRGYCTAGGWYSIGIGTSDAMVVTEARGHWAQATQVRLPAGAGAVQAAEVHGVTCTSAGDCVAVGQYDSSSGAQAFVVTQKGGSWGRARRVPAPPNSIAGRGGELYAVACTGRGACEAAGSYSDRRDYGQGMVVAEVAGHWRRAAELRMPAGAATDPEPYSDDITGISCAGSGDCVIVGSYYISDTNPDADLAMVVVQSRGRWDRAARVKLPKNAAPYESALTGVSCLPGGRCLATGWYIGPAGTSSSDQLAVWESGGRWGAGTQVTAEPPQSKGASLAGVGCATSRLCVSGGSYVVVGRNLRPSTVRWTAGKWAHAAQLSQPASANSDPYAAVWGVGCASDGYCAAAGYFVNRAGAYVPMVAAT
jgi:hypothetical protein